MFQIPFRNQLGNPIYKNWMGFGVFPGEEEVNFDKMYYGEIDERFNRQEYSDTIKDMTFENEKYSIVGKMGLGSQEVITVSCNL